MKLIIVDFLRRWWGGYLLAVLFVDSLEAINSKLGLLFACILILPCAFEGSRGSFGVLRTLPVSRRSVTASFWFLAVVLPVLLITASAGLVSVFFPSSSNPVNNVTLIFFGSIGCLAGSAGLLLVFWRGWWVGELLIGWTPKCSGRGQISVGAPDRVRSLKPKIARFGGVYFDLVWRWFLAGAVYAAIMSHWNNAEADFSGMYFFALVGAGSSEVSFGGLRLLRSLPLSVEQLALNLLLIPVFSILCAIAGMAAIQRLGLGHLPIHDPVSLLITLTGITCLACSFTVLFSGRDGHILAYILTMGGVVGISSIVVYTKWSPIFWGLIGICLMGMAFCLNRRWLRCSASYRAPKESLARRRG
ncbi:MAG TPA: hypothetical protein VH595_05850 [Verrucomicrobiae bacterium]|jgi:hypothetical protein|nr:hypothetical protein [Verrucomicrobiae bacterium]